MLEDEESEEMCEGSSDIAAARDFGVDPLRDATVQMSHSELRLLLRGYKERQLNAVRLRVGAEMDKPELVAYRPVLAELLLSDDPAKSRTALDRAVPAMFEEVLKVGTNALKEVDESWAPLVVLLARRLGQRHRHTNNAVREARNLARKLDEEGGHRVVRSIMDAWADGPVVELYQYLERVQRAAARLDRSLVFLDKLVFDSFNVSLHQLQFMAGGD